jgi:hypothetical protein
VIDWFQFQFDISFQKENNSNFSLQVNSLCVKVGNDAAIDPKAFQKRNDDKDAFLTAGEVIV